VVAYVFLFALFLFVLGTIVAACVGYVRLMVGLFARQEPLAAFWRFMTYVTLSFNALFLHTAFRLGIEEAGNQFPSFSFVLSFGILLLFPGYIALANIGVLLAQRFQAPRRSQVVAGIAAPLLGGIVLTSLHTAAAKTHSPLPMSPTIATE
jgi:hypothetical protein